MKKNVNIAVIGLGQIGIYLYNELQKKKKLIELKTGKKIKIVGISARNKNKKRRFTIDKKIFFSNPLDIIKKTNVDILFESIGSDRTLITPCIALAPYLALAGPVIVSRPEDISKNVSNKPLTLQKPVGLMGRPSSSTKKEPQAPGPDKTGDLIAVKCSWPDPRLIQTPGDLLNACLGCWASNSFNSSWLIEEIDWLLDQPFKLESFFSKTITSWTSSEKAEVESSVIIKTRFFSLVAMYIPSINYDYV